MPPPRHVSVDRAQAAVHARLSARAIQRVLLRGAAVVSALVIGGLTLAMASAPRPATARPSSPLTSADPAPAPNPRPRSGPASLPTLYDSIPHPDAAPAVIRLAVGPDVVNAPFVVRDQQGRWTGFAIDLLTDSARTIGARVELVELPKGTDLIQAAREKRYDIHPVIFVGGDLTPDFEPGRPMLKVTPGVWGLAGAVPLPTSADQLGSFRIGVQAGGPSERWLRSVGITPTLRRDARIELANDLLEGRVDIVVATHATMAPQLALKSDRAKFVFGSLSEVPTIGSVTYGVTPHASAAGYWLGQGLDFVGASGRYFDLYTKYLKDNAADGDQAIVSEAVYLKPLTSSGRSAGRQLRVAIEDRGSSFARLCTTDPATGITTGYSVDLARALGKAMGREVQLTTLNAPHGSDAVARGKFDAVIVTDIDDLETDRLEYSSPLITMSGALFTRQQTTAPQTLEELRKMKLAVTWGGRAHQYAIQAELPNVRLLSNWQELFAELESGSIDGVIGLSAPVRSLQASGAIATPIVEHSLPGDGYVSFEAIAVRAGNNLLLWDLRDAIATITQSGELGDIYDRWWGDIAPRQVARTFGLRTVLIAAAAAAAMLVAMGTGWFIARQRLARHSLRLAQTEQAIQLVTNALPVLVYSYSVAPDGRRKASYLSGNIDKYSMAFGSFTLDKPYEQAIGHLLHPDDVPEYARRADRARSHGETFDFTFRLRDVEHNYRWLRSVAAGRQVDDLRVWDAMLMEVTQEQETILRARNSEARFRAIVEHAPHAAIQFYDHNARVVAWNDASTRLYGWTAEEALGKSIGQLMLDDAGQTLFLAEIQRLAQGGTPAPPTQLPFRGKSGRSGWLLSSVFPLPELDPTTPQTFVCMDVDVTSQQLARMESDRLRGSLAIALEASRTGAWSVDIPTNSVIADQTVIDLFGLTGIVTPGQPTPNEIFFANIAPEDLAAIQDAWNRALQGDGLYACQFRTRVNGIERWINGRGRVVCAPDGKPVQMVGVSAEITELKVAEHQRQQLLLAQERAKRLEALGLLAGGIAHDFNNLLTAVMGNAALAQQSVPTGSPPYAQLEQVQHAARFASELTQQLLTYAGRRTPTLASTDLADVIDQTTPLFRSVVGPDIRLDVTHQQGLPPVFADRVQLRQVVLNILLNAADAASNTPSPTAEKPTVSVRTCTLTLSEPRYFTIPATRELATGAYVVIEITDNGRGIDLAGIERIFEPFYSTKVAGRGLGLSIVRSVVESLSGAISVYPAPGRGTTFAVILPQTNQPTPTPAPAPTHARPQPHYIPRPLQGLCILVVDDEPLVRRVFSSVLNSAGAEVLAAADAPAAADLLRARLAQPARPPVACAVIDLVMPHTDGLATAEMLRKLTPMLPVVISSGYAAESLAANVRELPASTFLQKPFAPADLVENVRLLTAQHHTQT